MSFMTILPVAVPVLAMFSALVCQFMTGGERRPWLLPVCLMAQTATTSWAVTVLPAYDLPLTLLLSTSLVTLAIIDSICLRLPDALTLPLMAAGLVLKVRQPDTMLEHAIAAIIAYGSLSSLAWAYRKLRHRDGLGIGDAKLLAGAATWLGWQPLPLIILTASCCALIQVAALRLVTHRPIADVPVPLGPSLCLGFWLYWLYGA